MKKISLNKSDIRNINKIGNVEYNKLTGKIEIDNYSKKIYNNIKKEIVRLENQYNIDLTKYRNRLKRDYNNLKKEVRNVNSNKNNILEKDFTELKHQSFKLSQIEDMVRELNPNRHSKDFKKVAMEKQKTSQLDNVDISEKELDYWQDVTGLDRGDIDTYLYPVSDDEESWYEQYLDMVDNGIDEETARITTNEWYENHKPKQINNKYIYNMEDVIENFVPKNERENARQYLKSMTNIRLLNLGE